MDIGSNVSLAFDHGRLNAIGVTALPLVGTPTQAKRGVYVHAPAANPATVYLGNADVTTDTADATDGFPLIAGATSPLLPIEDVSKLYARAASGTTSKLFFWWC